MCSLLNRQTRTMICWEKTSSGYTTDRWRVARRNDLWTETGRSTPKRQDHFWMRCSSLTIWLLWHQSAIVIASRAALEAETGADYIPYAQRARPAVSDNLVRAAKRAF